MRLPRILRPAGTMGRCLALCLASFPLAMAHLGIDEQIAVVDAKIARDPADAALYLQRGELHRAHGDDAAALADYRRARRLDPGIDAVDLAIGRLHLDTGRLGRAEAALDRFLRRRPDDAAALAIRGRIRAQRGRHLAAADDLTRAISLSASPETAYFLERAAALAAVGGSQVELALQGLDQGMERLGPLVTLQRAAIDLELRAGRPDAALSRLDRIASTSARKETWLARRGEILERAGRATEARQAFEQALEAIGAVPDARRETRAMASLEAEVRAALARLAPAAAPPGGDR